MMIEFFLKRKKKKIVCKACFLAENLIFCSEMNTQVACEIAFLEGLLNWPVFLLGLLT